MSYDSCYDASDARAAAIIAPCRYYYAAMRC